MHYALSEYVKQRVVERGITFDIIDQIINFPQQVVSEEETGQKIYQSVIDYSEKKTYSVRVFVHTTKEPNIVKSAYRTSKIEKYYEGEI